MTAAHPLPKQGILDIKPYIGGEGRVAGVTDLLRLASNENALGCSPKARDAYLACANDLFRYPDGSAGDLRAALGKTYKMNPDNIVCGSGSEELISLLVRAYAGPGDEVLFPQYGFLMYPICAKAVGATPVLAPENDFRTDVDALLKAVTPKTKMLLLANPNNPTGSYITREELKHLCEKVPSNVLILLDSAYAEFVQAADYSDGRDMVDAHPNVVMLRTFSKIYGLAALRLGWGYCSPDVAGVVNRVRGAFNVNAPAQAAGVAALSDTDFLKRTIEMTTTGRKYLAENIGGLGYRVLPSVGNFLLVELGENAEKIRLGLKDKGIFIRQMGAYNLPRHLRVTVGTSDDNARLVNELKKLKGTTMTRNQQWILIAIGALIGAALVVGIIKKKFPDVARGGKPAVERVATGTAGQPAPVVIPYKGAPPAPRDGYDPKLNQTIQAVTGQLRMLDSSIARAIMRKKLGFEEFEKLNFGGAAANVDPAYAVFNPDGKIKFRPMMGAWIDQAMLDTVTKQKNMQIYYSLRRQTSPSGTTDVLFAVIPSPVDKVCERVLSYKVKPTLKFAVNNAQVVTDEAGAIPNNAMKVASCITSGDGRVYYFHPLRARFLRQGRDDVAGPLIG